MSGLTATFRQHRPFRLRYPKALDGSAPVALGPDPSSDLRQSTTFVGPRRSGQRSATVGTETGGARWKEWKETSGDRSCAKAGGAAASAVGEWRSLRTAAQPPTSRDGDSRLVSIQGLENTRQSPKFKRRVPVTASIAWPDSILEMEERSKIRWQHRLKRGHPTGTERRIAQQRVRMEGWRQ